MEEIILSELVEAVKKVTGEKYEVMIHSVQKNNGIQLQVINCKRKRDSVVVSVYVDQFIEAIAQKEMTVADAAEKVFEIAAVNKVSECCIDTSRLTDKDFVLSHVEYQVVNRKLNQDRIDKMPHKYVLDLLVLYRVIFSSDASDTVSYVINNKVFEQIGISIEELDKAANYNTEKTGFKVRTMAEIMIEMAGMSAESIHEICEEQQIYVLTNIRGINGANILLYNNILNCLADEVGDDLFILPSSIHEVLAVPASQMKSDELAAIVAEVNISAVADEEILGWQVYKYSRINEKLSIV